MLPISSRNMGTLSVTILIFLTTMSFPLARASCYFPMAMQGEFTTQWKIAKEITYTSLSITYNSIPGWGSCHSRHQGHLVILQDLEAVVGLRDQRGVDEDVMMMMGLEPQCFRCIRLVQRSVNVNQVHARDINRCHATAEAALASCPTGVDVKDREVEEIMLYKTRGFYGESAVTQVHCPFSGSYTLSYRGHGGSTNVAESLSVAQLTTANSCHTTASEAAVSCPNEYMLELRFRQCPEFPDFDMSFQCLGHWTGDDGQDYVSLLDTKLPQLGEEPRPRYRCAVYKRDEDANGNGMIRMALSNDSTCVHQLVDHNTGYETLVLEERRAEEVDQALVIEMERQQRRLMMTGSARTAEEQASQQLMSVDFPAWSQGVWADRSVSVDGSALIYRNANELTTYLMRALVEVPTTKHHHHHHQQHHHSRRFVVALSTTCSGRQQLLGYACVALERRTDHIVELKVGRHEATPDLDLCRETHTGWEVSSWVTVSKDLPQPVVSSHESSLRQIKTEDPATSVARRSACPLSGVYTGRIPDAEGLCARSSTPWCTRPDLMAYQVFNCDNTTEIYEDRLYQCHGQFEDVKDGLVYTYTQRLDLPIRECFVGTSTNSGNEAEVQHFVMEAGEHCQRGKRPQDHGMVMVKDLSEPVCGKPREDDLQRVQPMREGSRQTWLTRNDNNDMPSQGSIYPSGSIQEDLIPATTNSRQHLQQQTVVISGDNSQLTDDNDSELLVVMMEPIESTANDNGHNADQDEEEEEIAQVEYDDESRRVSPKVRLFHVDLSPTQSYEGPTTISDDERDYGRRHRFAVNGAVTPSHLSNFVLICLAVLTGSLFL